MASSKVAAFRVLNQADDGEAPTVEGLQLYVDHYTIVQLMEKLVTELVRHRPADYRQFLVDELTKMRDGTWLPRRTGGDGDTSASYKSRQSEAAEEYLKKYRVRTMMEMICLQLMVHRPPDPFQFMQELLEMKPAQFRTVCNRPVVRQKEAARNVSRHLAAMDLELGKAVVEIRASLVRAEKDIGATMTDVLEDKVIEPAEIADLKAKLAVAKGEITTAIGKSRAFILRACRLATQDAQLSKEEMDLLDKRLLQAKTGVYGTLDRVASAAMTHIKPLSDAGMLKSGGVELLFSLLDQTKAEVEGSFLYLESNIASELQGPFGSLEALVKKVTVEVKGTFDSVKGPVLDFLQTAGKDQKVDAEEEQELTRLLDETCQKALQQMQDGRDLCLSMMDSLRMRGDTTADMKLQFIESLSGVSYAIKSELVALQKYIGETAASEGLSLAVQSGLTKVVENALTRTTQDVLEKLFHLEKSVLSDITSSVRDATLQIDGSIKDMEISLDQCKAKVEEIVTMHEQKHSYMRVQEDVSRDDLEDFRLGTVDDIVDALYDAKDALNDCLGRSKRAVVLALKEAREDAGFANHIKLDETRALMAALQNSKLSVERKITELARSVEAVVAGVPRLARDSVLQAIMQALEAETLNVILDIEVTVTEAVLGKLPSVSVVIKKASQDMQSQLGGIRAEALLLLEQSVSVGDVGTKLQRAFNKKIGAAAHRVKAAFYAVEGAVSELAGVDMDDKQRRMLAEELLGLKTTLESMQSASEEHVRVFLVDVPEAFRRASGVGLAVNSLAQMGVELMDAADEVKERCAPFLAN